MFRIFFLFLFLVGCGNVSSGYIDPEAQPYVDRFERLIGIYPIGVSISLVDDLPLDVVGRCYLKPLSSSISLNKAYWNIFSDYGKEQVVFHELGHCFLSLQHSDRIFRDLCPASIMYHSHFGESPCYSIHRNELLMLYKEDSGL